MSQAVPEREPVGAASAAAEEHVVADHRVLFAEEGAHCDACGAPLAPANDDEGYDVPGEGLYVWTRGDEVRFEQAPLCPACASAIGATALARWAIEEEEG